MSVQSTVSTSGTPSGLLEVLAELRERLRGEKYCAQRLLRVSLPVELDNTPLEIAAACRESERQIFATRDNKFTLVGFGHSRRLSTNNAEQTAAILDQAQQLVAGSDACWLGGCSFAGNTGVGRWQEFPAACFVLPLVELRETNGFCEVAINMYAESYAQWQTRLEAIDQLVGEISAIPSLAGSRLPALVARRDTISLREWRELVMNALEAIRGGGFKKVVLAREVELCLTAPADPFAALAQLDRQHNPGYLFALISGKDHFFGCSPERLFKQKGHQLVTEALAGTVRRGLDGDEDAALESRLIQSRKLVHEHQLVADAIHSALCPLALQLSPVSDVGVVKLRHIQHSYQKVSAILRPDVSIGQLFSSLHPTPAICGYPSAQAKAFIRDHEHFQRGWYSGVAGVIGAEHAEFSVAIRSGLARGDKVWLYSGVGIVRGSNPVGEWRELESKLQVMLDTLLPHAH